MKLEKEMYVRFRNNGIDKIKKINKNSIHYEIAFYSNRLINDNNKNFDIIKASHNILDLIEVRDYVNGSPVCSIKKDENNKTWIYTDSNYKVGILENEIETILTKESFENNCYKI